jgi:hypothetical protein
MPNEASGEVLLDVSDLEPPEPLVLRHLKLLKN